MVFKDIWILGLMPIALLIVIFLCRRKKDVSLRIPSQDLIRPLKPTWRIRFSRTPFYIRLLALSLFFVALAGPRFVEKEAHYQTEGIEIVLAIDCSGSMAAEDFTKNGQRINRLAIIKEVVEDFIDQRVSDRIGLVAFAGLAYTVCPLTTDYSWLKENLRRIELGVIEDGTAIGSALSSSVARLKDSKAKSKIIVLLTDGMNNAGKVDPLAAAQAAKTFGIKVYTIGAGAKGYVPFPVQDFFGRKAYQNVLVDIDEKMLTQIADTTGGKYFRASDTDSLRNIYHEIDQLEKVKIEQVGFLKYTELFEQFLITALILLLAGLFLDQTLFFRVP